MSMAWVGRRHSQLDAPDYELLYGKILILPSCLVYGRYLMTIHCL